MSDKYNICIIGSNPWATTIARNVATNAELHQDLESIVKMYVFEEIINGEKITDIINTTHINVKYKPNYVLPSNLVAVDDVVATARNADIIIFAIPPSYVLKCCTTLLGKVKPTAHAVSLIRGFEKSTDGNSYMISHIIMKQLKIACSTLVGCGLPPEITNNRFCECTIGCRDQKFFHLLSEIFKSEQFRVVVTDDADGIEASALLRTIFAFGAGCADGMEENGNTKVAIIRRSFLEIIHFIDLFYPGSRLGTTFESAAFSDLIISCFNSRNRKLGEIFVRSGQTLAELEAFLPQSNEPLGPSTVKPLVDMLQKKGLAHEFPLICCLDKICSGDWPLTKLLDVLKTVTTIYHPKHLFPL